jgi:hypothetical protein
MDYTEKKIDKIDCVKIKNKYIKLCVQKNNYNNINKCLYLIKLFSFCDNLYN